MASTMKIIPRDKTKVWGFWADDEQSKKINKAKRTIEDNQIIPKNK
jgi:hypothetical protein